MLVNIPASFIPQTMKIVPGMTLERHREEDAPLPINVRFLEDKQLEQLEAMLAKDPAGVGVRRQISGWRNAVKDPANAKPGTLNAWEAALIDYFVEGAIRGWVFSNSQIPVPYLVKDVQYHKSWGTGDNHVPAYIQVDMISTGDHGSHHTSIYSEAEGVKGKSIVEWLDSKGYRKETPELIKSYDDALKHWKSVSEKFGRQLQLVQSVTHDVSGKRRPWWGDSMSQDTVDLMTLGAGRVVCERRPFRDSADPSNRRSSRSTGRSYRDESYVRPANANEKSALMYAAERKFGEEATPFSEIPHDLMVDVFHLEANTELRMHAFGLKVYEYNKLIKNSLVLPDDVVELLDTLTTEVNLVQEDVIRGKLGGNTIMLAGPPGTGKTLTAEVYSEHTECVLYKLYSGQLGTDAESVTKALKTALQRAATWGKAMILIDEFDVFGRQRGEDLEQNAIVAAFLTTLEYQNNTMFLTTNRHDTMDDAILSRCAAILVYNRPEGEQLKKVWRVLRNHYLRDLTDEMIDEIVESEKDMKIAGRDVKAVLRLAARYKNAGHTVDVKLLKKCATFRGIQAV